MGTRITKTLVDELKPPPRKPDGGPAQLFIRDTSIPGFGLRVTSGGAKSFIVETRIRGRVRRTTLGKYGQITVAQARNLAMERLGLIAQGRDPKAEERAETHRGVTLGQAFHDYLLSRKDLKPGTIKNYRKCVDGCLSDWKRKRLVDIDKAMVEQRHREIGRGAPARANNVMRVLRAVFNHAIELYEDEDGRPTITSNPVSRLSRARAWYRIERRTGRIRPSDMADWVRGIETLPNQVTQDYLLFLIYTGLRKQEGATLRWENVDLTSKTLTVPDTKNREPHTLPLTGPILEILERRQFGNDSEWVFLSPRNDGPIRDSRNAIRQVVDRSGVAFTHHDLRRTFITTAESLDISAYALKRLANHRMPNDVTSGYIITDVERLREPMEKVSSFLEKQLFPHKKSQRKNSSKRSNAVIPQLTELTGAAQGAELQLDLLL